MKIEAASTLEKSADLICEFLLPVDPVNFDGGRERSYPLPPQIGPAVREQNLAYTVELQETLAPVGWLWHEEMLPASRAAGSLFV